MRKPSTLIASPALVVIAAATAAAFAPCAAGAATPAPAPAITVGVHSASGAPGSYFVLSGKPGATANAGTLEIDNRRAKRVVVRLDPVGALTASTLGSAYTTAGSALSRPAAWTHLQTRQVVLGPHGHANVPVTTAIPAGTAAGDYLSGLSVQALGQERTTRVRGNIAVSSVQRYAVGMLVAVPGPRHSLIQITSARIARDPAGLTFYLHARNAGNAILKNVRGWVLITRGRRVVARTAIGPGTFVTATSIDYPVLVAREQPREGAFYRVRALMRYRGGVARFDNKVSFGHKAAQAQQDFGGPPVTDGRSGIPVWLVVLAFGAAFVVATVALLLFLRRRRTRGPLVALRALEAAIAEADGDPLSVVRIVDVYDWKPARKLAGAVRTRLRPSDALYRLSKYELLVILPGTHADAAEILYADLRSTPADVRVREVNNLEAEILLKRLREPRGAPDEIELSPEMIQRWTSASKDEQLS
jgi:Bacterial signalling protein N terminal repeat